MDLLKQLGQICRQHYEKILLTLTLLGLAFAVWILYSASKAEEEKVAGMVVDLRTRKVKAVKPIDLAPYEQALKVSSNSPDLDLGLPHHLINPVKWQRKPDGTIIKIQTGDEVGVGQIEVTKVTPLYYRITLDKINAPGSYFLGVQDESATNPVYRVKVPKYTHITDNKKNDVFILQESKGTPESPELVLELVSNQQKVTVSKEQPYQRIEAYKADLKYKLDGRQFPEKRVGDILHFGGEDYKIVAINPDEVVLSALVNNRNYTVK